MKVDNREPDKVFRYVEELGIPYSREQLELGDFVDEEHKVLIERKSVEDFVMSMKNNHLPHQLVRMQESGYTCYLIISGDFGSLHFNPMIKLNTEQMLGMLASVAARYNVKMVQVANDRQLVRLVQKLCEKTNDGKETIIHYNSRISTDNFVNILMCVRGIGLRKAEIIKEKYQTFANTFRALEQETFEVKGISQTIKENMKEAFGLNQTQTLP